MYASFVDVDGLKGVNDRLLVYNLRDPQAAPKQFLYRTDSPAFAISEILAINDPLLIAIREALIAEGRFQGQMDSPLTAVGLAQAEAVARRLAGRRRPPVLPVPVEPPLEIVHSPLARTAATAARIAAAIEADKAAAAGPTGAPPMQPAVPTRGDPGFLEIAQGDWEGLTGTEITERYADSLAAWRRRPWESVSFPSSRIWRRMLNTSGCAFSISSSSSTEYGLRRTASVSWPPSS